MRFNGVTENEHNSEQNTKTTPEQFVYIWNIPNGKSLDFKLFLLIRIAFGRNLHMEHGTWNMKNVQV